ncbi:MAG TPA: lysylphosphatidylglycerol synthase transmembrane domain-containing protein [Candidatus Bilamarchaeaceae archaeon]|nr:lysylphosphatidylglycerol synthase transmembrane domain-containing protein [Candidatus Bilamarchaeaceae archaeon]
MRQNHILLINAAISIVLIAAILYYVGIMEVLGAFASLDLFFLFISIVFLLLMYLGMITRIRILLEESGVKASWTAIARSHWVGMLLADFTPARAGYFAAAATLHHQHDVPSERALLSIWGPQIFDFALKLTAGTLAVYYIVIHFLNAEDSSILFLGTAAMTVFIAIMLLALFSARFLRLFQFASRWPLVGSMVALVKRMQQHAHVVVKKTPDILVILAYTWSMKAISWYFVAKSLGITINVSPFPEVVFYYFFQPLITMLEFVPSPTLAGIGLSEGGGTLVMALFGVSPAAAAAFVLLARVKTTLVNLIAVPDSLNLLQRMDWRDMMKH